MGQPPTTPDGKLAASAPGPRVPLHRRRWFIVAAAALVLLLLVGGGAYW